MSLYMHTLKANPKARVKKFRVGRGTGSGRGTTAGRGTKGQRARTGGRKGLRLKGIKQMILGFPKMRGFTSRTSKAVTIPLSMLEQFTEGTRISMTSLREKNLIGRQDQRVKIVGAGPITKKFLFEGVGVSAGARAAIEKAGGTFAKAAKKKIKK